MPQTWDYIFSLFFQLQKRAEEEGYTFVSAYDDPLTIAGKQTSLGDGELLLPSKLPLRVEFL